jgi:predicted RNase H-like nuclease
VVGIDMPLGLLGSGWREADRFRGSCGFPLYEVHLELAFCVLAGAPLAHSKHTAAGRERRREVLSRAGIALPRIPRAPVTDTLDAAAVACSAWRIATGRAVVIPARPQRDDRGLPIAIRY